MTFDDSKPNTPMDLDDLLLQGTERMRSTFRRPTDQDIEAYLQGRATADQRANILAALARSPEFMGEIGLRIGESVRDTKEQREAFAAAAVSPEADALVASVLAAVKAGEVQPGRQSQRGNPWDRASRLLSIFLVSQRRLMAVVAITVSAVILILVARTSGPSESWELVATFDPQTFLSEDIRGNLDEPVLAADAMQAAMLELRTRIHYDEGGFHFEAGRSAEPFPNLPQVVRLSLSTPTGEVQSFTAQVPALPTPLTMWIISFPSGRLMKHDLQAEDVALRWDPGGDNQAAATLTYPTGPGFSAAPAQWVLGSH